MFGKERIYIINLLKKTRSIQTNGYIMFQGQPNIIYVTVMNIYGTPLLRFKICIDGQLSFKMLCNIFEYGDA